MSKDDGIDVSIVTYRSLGLVVRCLEALSDGWAAPGMHVTVVDNASGDGTLGALETRFPWVHTIDAGANIGFSAGMNLAARAGSSPLLLVLNPDVRVTLADLRALKTVLADHPKVGAIGPQLVREDGTLDHACRRSFPTIVGALGHFAAVGRGPRAPRALAQYRAPDVVAGPVDAINGAFMLLRREAFEAVGGFDEGYWMYMEDLDLCWRLRNAGWLTWYEPSVTAIHVKGGSSGRLRTPRLNAAFHYGMFRFYRKNYAPARPRLLNAVVYVGIATKLAVSVVRTELRRLAARA